MLTQTKKFARKCLASSGMVYGVQKHQQFADACCAPRLRFSLIVGWCVPVGVNTVGIARAMFNVLSVLPPA
jgi:hypothetical protein